MSSRHLFIVPSRNRDYQQELFLKEFVSYLNYEDISEYKILLLYQNNTKNFNLGWNINVGFDLFDRNNFNLEYDFNETDNVIFHPVDGCPISLNQKFNNKMLTSFLHGGTIELCSLNKKTIDGLNFGDTSENFKFKTNIDEITRFTPRYTFLELIDEKVIVQSYAEYGTYYKALGLGRNAYKKINGHSNLLYGWGADDDDFLMRINKSADVKLKTIPILWNWYFNNFVEPQLESHEQKLKNIYQNDNFNVEHSGLNTLRYSSKIIKLNTNIYKAIIDEI